MPETSKDRQIANIYKKLLERLSMAIAPRLFENLFDEDIFELKSLDNNKAVFVAESSAVATIIKSTYLSLLSTELDAIAETHYEIEIVDKVSYSRKRQAVEQVETKFFKNSYLQSQYSFDNFVTGPSNRDAYVASLFAISNPGANNPIFLYSKSGLGKTHLLNAIGNEYKIKYPNSKVLYITTDDFISEFVRFIKGNKDSENLKDFFNTVDILMVDDIQFLAGKEDTQIMFFNVFNLLVSQHKQIILTSDRSPSELKGLQDRLVSRFSGGLSIQISCPDKSTLIEILKLKIKVNSLPLDFFDNDVLEYLALNYSRNVRELEGAFTKLLFAVTVHKPDGKVTLKFAKNVFEDDERKRANSGKIDMGKIIKTVAEHYSLTESQLKSKVRTSQIAYARKIAMYLCRSLLSLPYQVIGREFGKDHTTVMSNVQTIVDGLQDDSNLKNAIDTLTSKIKKTD